jgi:predicted nucleic-acid-binding protein
MGFALDSGLLAARELEIESESSLELALDLFRNHKADFADCVHIALSQHAGHSPLWTFDKAASQVEGAAMVNGQV